MITCNDIMSNESGKSSAVTYHAENRSDIQIRPETIMSQLAEARFISNFMTSVCSSLELEDICSIAARSLYQHTPYYRIIFTFSEDCDERTITFSPMLQKGHFNPKSKITVGRGGKNVEHGTSDGLASAHLNLFENIGAIDIYYKESDCGVFSESLLVCVAACFSQAVKNSQEHRKMKDLAMRDGLTGLFNRRVFDESLARKIKDREMEPLSLLLIDLDNFKKVNDTYGHDAGDQVLKTFARILKESCRGQDVVARFGGEEFAIILSQTKPETAHAIAQRIRHRLAKTSFTFDDRQLKMTTSIGLASCKGEGGLFTANLVKQADRALYQAKRTGKNRVCVYPADLLINGESLAADSYGICAPAHC